MAVTVGVRQLRSNLREYLSRARDGEDVIVTERGKAIARISSVSERRVLDELVAAGMVTPAKRPKTPIDPAQLIPVKESVSDIVIEQRR